MAMQTDAARRIDVVFPADVLDRLESAVPFGERDRFIVEATEHLLRQERLKEVLAQLRETPAWSGQDHPDLMSVEDVNRYVRRLRETWMPRSWDEIAGEAERGMAGAAFNSPFPMRSLVLQHWRTVWCWSPPMRSISQWTGYRSFPSTPIDRSVRCRKCPV